MKNTVRKLFVSWSLQTDVVVLFFLALALRISMLVVSAGQVGLEGILESSPDAMNYWKMATQIIGETEGQEAMFFTFGPGYAYFLAASRLLLGSNLLPTILLNILISSLSIVLIFRLCTQLINSRTTALLAGFLAAVSYTSITLSCYLLSDTLFVFAFLLGLVLYLNALKQENWSSFVYAGLVLGGAILVRSIGQFWPVAMILIAAGFWLIGRRKRTAQGWKIRTLALRVLVCLLIILSVVSVWVVRNLRVHDVPALAFTSAGGPANLALFTLERLEELPQQELRQRWHQQYLQQTGKSTLSLADQYELYIQRSRIVFDSLPGEVVKTYLLQTWDNLTEICYYHRSLVPKFNSVTIGWEHRIRELGLNYLNVILSMIGLLLLLLKRNYLAFIVLGLVYFYFASMIGFTRWQGSRLFFPGQIASSILIATALSFPVYWLMTFPFVHHMANRLRLGFGAVWTSMKQRSRRMNVVNSRWFFVLYASVSLLGVTFLFRSFVFSTDILYGDDMVKIGMFFRSFLVEHVKETGSIPGWNPYMFGGLPFVAAFHGDIFYPFSILKYFGNLYRSIGWTLVIHIYLAGIFMYFAAREHGLGRVASSMAGVAYGFSGYLVSFIAPGHDGKIFVTTLFPLSILFLSRAFRVNPILNFGLLAIVLGCILLAPHPQMSYYVLLCVGAYGSYHLVKGYFRDRSGRRLFLHGAMLSCAVLVGLLLSGIQMYPGYDYTTKYSPRSERHTGYQWATSWSLHPEELFSQVVPEFAGVDSKKNAELAYWGRNSFKDNSEWAGTVALFLAMLSVFHWRRYRGAFWGGVAFVSLLFALGDHTVLFPILYRLMPFVGMMRAPSMVMFLFAFSVSLMAGICVQSLVDRARIDSRFGRRCFDWILWGVPITIGCLCALYWLAGEETLRLYARLFYPALLGESGRVPERLQDAIINLPSIKNGFAVALTVTGFTSAFIWLFRRKTLRSGLLLVLPAISMLHGVAFNERFITTIDGQRFEEKAIAEFLQDRVDNSRAFGFACNELVFNLYQNKIASPIGYHGNELKWYHDLLNRHRFSSTFFDRRFVNLLGARYLIYPIRGTLPLDTLGPIPLDTAAIIGNYVIFENKNCFPRAFVVNKYEVIQDRTNIIDEVVKGTKDLRAVALLEEEPELRIDPTDGRSATAEIVHYEPDSVVVNVACSTNTLLVLTDNYYTAWHAAVDGVDAKILRAYGSFRAVEVPAHSRVVSFVYESRTYGVGKALTLLGILIVSAVLFGCSVARIRSRGKKRHGNMRSAWASRWRAIFRLTLG